MNKEDNNKIIYAIITIIILAVINIGLVINYKGFNLTGKAVDTATINITINQKVSANFTSPSINWGGGTVDAGETNATLNSSGPTVLRGDWVSTGVSDLQLVNNGNINVSLDLKSSVSAAAFIGGSNPNFTIRVFDHEANSCKKADGTGVSPNYGNYTDANTTADGTRYCEIFQFLDSNDAVNFTVFLRVPFDTNTSAGVRNAILTATANAV